MILLLLAYVQSQIKDGEKKRKKKKSSITWGVMKKKERKIYIYILTCTRCSNSCTAGAILMYVHSSALTP